LIKPLENFDSTVFKRSNNDIKSGTNAADKLLSSAKVIFFKNKNQII